MVTVGPLALATERLIAVFCIFVFLAAFGWIARRHGKAGEPFGMFAVIVGIIAARAGFVVQNWPAFAVEPATIFYLWQGGFSSISGVAAAAIVLLIAFRKSSLVWPMGALLVASAAVWFLANSLLNASVRQPLPEGIVVTSLHGEQLDFKAMQGAPFVINLWASWCPPCRREMPMLIDEAARSSVPVFLVNQGEEPAHVQEWLRQERLSDTAVRLDREAAAGEALGVTGLPATIFVDGDGMISELHLGEISRGGLRAGLRGVQK